MRYSRIQIRQAILMAADHIEQKPERFEFYSYAVPKHGDCKACYLGWIGYFLGMPRNLEEDNSFKGCLDAPTLNSEVCNAAFNLSTGKFYEKLPLSATLASGKKAAEILRLFAETYYPQETLDGSREIARLCNETSPEGQVRTEQVTP